MNYEEDKGAISGAALTINDLQILYLCLLKFAQVFQVVTYHADISYESILVQIS